MHDERPTPAILELADTEGVGETGWTPPARQAFGMTERGKDLLYCCRDFTRCTERSHPFLRFGGYLQVPGILA